MLSSMAHAWLPSHSRPVIPSTCRTVVRETLKRPYAADLHLSIIWRKSSRLTARTRGTLLQSSIGDYRSFMDNIPALHSVLSREGWENSRLDCRTVQHPFPITSTSTNTSKSRSSILLCGHCKESSIGVDRHNQK